MSHEILGALYHESEIVVEAWAEHECTINHTPARRTQRPCDAYVQTRPYFPTKHCVQPLTYLFQRPGGTYALYCHVIRTDGVWELQQPFSISGSFKSEDGSVTPFHLLHADIQSAVHSCIGDLNGDANSQPHLIKWAFKEAHCIRENRCYGFIAECLVTKRAVLKHAAQAGNLFHFWTKRLLPDHH